MRDQRYEVRAQRREPARIIERRLQQAHALAEVLGPQDEIRRRQRTRAIITALLLGAFALSWLLGVLVPLAPGGLGLEADALGEVPVVEREHEVAVRARRAGNHPATCLDRSANGATDFAAIRNNPLFFDRGPGYATLSGGAAFNEFDVL